MKRGYVQDSACDAPPVYIKTVLFVPECTTYSGEGRNAGSTSAKIRIYSYDENIFCIMEDLVAALGAHRRTALSARILKRVGKQNVVWDWLLFNRDGEMQWDKVVNMRSISVYAKGLLKQALVTYDAVDTAKWWAAAFWVQYLDPPAVECPPSPIASPPITPLVDFASAAVAASDVTAPSPMEVEQESAWGEEEEEEEATVAPSVNSDAPLSHRERCDMIKAYSDIVQSTTQTISVLSPDNPARMSLEMTLHNSSVVLEILAPHMSNVSPVAVRIPPFPSTTDPCVRLSDRIRAAGHDPAIISSDTRMKIALLAASLYRKSEFPGPFKVTVWAGSRKVLRYHYTKETQHFMDQAIARYIDAEQDSSSTVTPVRKKKKKKKKKRRKLTRVVNLVEKDNRLATAVPLPSQAQSDRQ